VGVTAALAQSRAWSPKPIESSPFVNGNKVHTRLSEVLADTNPLESWRQRVVDNRALKADYVGLKAGDATRRTLWADHRRAFIVWEGQIEFNI
jgi:hypothetical protein